MRIAYIGRNQALREKILAAAGDCLLLLWDRWDDFGFKTRFPTECRIAGKKVDLGAVRIMFRDEPSSHTYLATRQHSGWDGDFPLEGASYLSVPEQVTFYEQLQSLLPDGGARDAAEILRDASYLVHIVQDPSALEQIDARAFRSSLQRERSAQKSFADGWKLLDGQSLNVADLTFDFRDAKAKPSTLALRFVPRSPLPHDVNVIIGPNGVGKSSLLRQLILCWMRQEPEGGSLMEARFVPKPNLSQLVAVSYSPFERLPVDTDDVDRTLKDKDVYRFFGFRGRRLSQLTGRSSSIRHSLAVPRENATRSLIGCLTDDIRFSTIQAWANKLRTLHRVLNSAIKFDVAAVRLLPGAPIDDIIVKDPLDVVEVIEAAEADADGVKKLSRYVPIAAGTRAINAPLLLQHVDLDGGVTFFTDGAPLNLSSGQRLFFYIVVNILGVIRRNSLVIVDEPKLFLHPSLEIQFVSMLKQILQAYGSKALLATHSVVTVREVPSACVHVLDLTDDGLVIKTPPFETFGGDVQRITSYVFGDRAISKPYEAWLRGLMEEYGSADAVLEALGSEINEEMILQLHAMEQGKW